MCMTIGYADGAGSFVATDRRVTVYASYSDYTAIAAASATFHDLGGKIIFTGSGWAVAAGRDLEACVALSALRNPPTGLGPASFDRDLFLVRNALRGRFEHSGGGPLFVSVIEPSAEAVLCIDGATGAGVEATNATVNFPRDLSMESCVEWWNTLCPQLKRRDHTLARRIQLAARAFRQAADLSPLVSRDIEVGYIMPDGRTGFLRGDSDEIAGSAEATLFPAFEAECENKVWSELMDEADACPALDANSRLVDATKTTQVAIGGMRSTQSENPVGASWTGSAYQINITAHTLKIGAVSVTYNSGAIGPASESTTYYVYRDDPTFAGGAGTYVATTNPVVLGENTGRYFVGKVTTGSGGGASTSSGGGGAKGTF